MKDSVSLSIVIPAKNEADNLKILLPELILAYPEAEIIVVDDGSSDDTARVCEINGVTIVTHFESKGNGASIKAGARHAKGDIVVFMDGDGQHKVSDVGQMLSAYKAGADMVVGARSRKSQANAGRLVANSLYNKLASMITGASIEDLTSGFRIVGRKQFLKFIYLLPNGFSYPTTITMAYFRSGFEVRYVPIDANKRGGSSHINVLKDGVRFFVIIFKLGTLYSPLKIFIPISFVTFCFGLLYYLYTYIKANSFTNMGALLFTTSVIIFLIGLVSEQITALMYKDSD